MKASSISGLAINVASTILWLVRNSTVSIIDCKYLVVHISSFTS